MNFQKTYFRMCTKINNYVPVRQWSADENEDEQWGCGYRDDVIAQFEHDFYNKNFDLQDQDKEVQIDTFEN